MTLVELIVTFAVAAIFMAAAAMLVVPATKMTLEVKAMNRVHDDAAIIMETIVNELSYAGTYAGGSIQLTDVINVADPADDLCDYNGYYREVKYRDKGGNPAVMRVTTAEDVEGAEDDTETVALVGEGKLLIAYDQIEDDVTGNLPIREKIDWSYGKGLYRDNEIRLGFQKKTDDKNIITVRLTVINTTSGYSYTQETDVRCINVTAENIQKEAAGP